MGFVAEIMSKEEAMKLPLKKRPICFRISSETYHGIWEAIGTASLCWEPRPAGAFDTEEASKVATELCFKVANEIEEQTEQLQRENAELQKALALKLDALPSGLSAGQSKRLEEKLERLQNFIESIADGEAEQDTTAYKAYLIMTGN